MAVLRKGNLIGVCVHHSVYQAAKNLTELKAHAAKFNSWHSTKSWAATTKTGGEFGYPYISYHYLIALDGSVLQTQDEKYVMYHAGDNFRGEKSFNLHGIAICLDGNYETRVPNDKQMLALVKLIRDIEKRYKIDALVRGHKETSKNPTACPGKNIGIHDSGWLKKVILNVNNPTYPSVELSDAQKLVECQKRVKTLEGEVADLKETLAVSQANEKTKSERIEFLEATIAVREAEMFTLEVDNDRILEENKRFEEEKNVAIKELNAYKKGRMNWFAQLLEKLFKKDTGN